ncbi:uncharacterized protein LOC141820920 [Curcuma longa]|uniref:uncharacterized protein LOC141820920 n=1 Tax=Curcuma longa TaxID=136217 RepID=UPI003D9F15F2
MEPSLRVRRSCFASCPADRLPPAMKPLRLALPRSAICRTLAGSEIGRRIVRIASVAPVKASSGAKVTSVSCSDIAPVPEARPSLRRTPPLASPGGIYDVEEKIEKVIYKCRFFAFLAVAGSLMGSIICFIKV